MNLKPLKILVLLFSVSAAGAFVWYASHKHSEPTDQASATRDTMFSTSKSKIIASDENVRQMMEDSNAAQAGAPVIPPTTFTDEQVRATRNIMLSSSKSSSIMSEEDLRKMLETKQKNTDTVKPGALLGSSKSGAVVTLPDIKAIIELDEKQKRELQPEAPAPVKPESLMKSSKSIDAILRREDVKQLVEPEKKPAAK